MNRILKVAAIMFVTAMFLALPLSAQSYKTNPLFEGPQSNTNKATAGVFGSDVDDAFDVNNYANVEFDKWFGYVHGYTFAATGTPANPFAIDLGYATNLGGGGGSEEGEGGGGGLRLGVRYVGNIMSMNKNVTHTLTPVWNQTTTQELTQVTEAFLYTTDWTNTTNQIEALIGIAGMGIQVGFFESLTVSSKPANQTVTILDTMDGRIVYTNDIIGFYNTRGHLTPFVGWGMNIGGDGSMKISPYAHLYFDFFQNKTATRLSTYTTLNGEVVSRKQINSTGSNNSYMLPAIIVGADFEMPKKENTTMGFGIGYGFNISIFNNDYGDSGISGTAKGTVSWTGGQYYEDDSISQTVTHRTATLTFADITAMNHVIAPSFSIINEVSEAFKFGLALEVPVSLGINKTDNYSQALTETTTKLKNADGTETVTKNKVHTNQSKSEITRLEVAPTVGVGASYKLIPNRFTVNAGVSARPVTFTNTVTKLSPNGPTQITYSETKTDGVLTSHSVTVNNSAPSRTNDSVQSQNVISYFSGNITGGFVFDFSQNMSLDLLCNFGTNTFTINLANVNVLISLKF